MSIRVRVDYFIIIRGREVQPTRYSMSSATEQARIRRERREKKILAQGSSRLEKIAGLQGGASAREALHPDPPEADISNHPSESVPTTVTATSPPAANVRRRSSDHGSPGRNLFSVDGGDEDPFNLFRAGNDPLANMPEDLRNDPMMKLLMSNPVFGQGMPSAGASSGGRMGGTSRDSSSDDLNRLAEKINKQLFAGISGNQTGEEQVLKPDTSAWKWKFLRIVSVVSVLGYLWTQLEDYHFSRNIDVTYGIVCLVLALSLMNSLCSIHSLSFLCRYRRSDSSLITEDRFQDPRSRRSGRFCPIHLGPS